MPLSPSAFGGLFRPATVAVAAGGVVAGVALLWGWRAFAPGAVVAARDAAALLRQARLLPLAAAVVCQAGVYGCVAVILRGGLSSGEAKIPSGAVLLRAGGAFLWANRALPGPAVAGLATLIWTLGRDRRHPVSAASAQAAAALFYLADYAGFAVVALSAMGALWGAHARHGGSGGNNPLPVTPLLLAVGIIFLGGGGAVIALRSPDAAAGFARNLAGWAVRIKERGKTQPPNLPRPSTTFADTAHDAVLRFYERWHALAAQPGRLRLACAASLIMHVLEIGTLFALTAAFSPETKSGGLVLGPRLAGGAAAGYVAGNLAAIVSFLPAGLGFFEGAMGVTLHLLGGVPVATATAATVAYRLLSVWLPLPAVIGTARQALTSAKAAQATASPAPANGAGTSNAASALSLWEAESENAGNGVD